MAMRGRGVRGNPNRPPRLAVGRVYEQFKPMSEWRQEDDYDTLLVYLPGFQKEYIKVTTEDLNIVRVRGERLVAENKWSRFQEDYRVPENCEMRGIRARFDGGILTITMPRKIPNTPAHTSTTTTGVPPKTEEQPFRRPTQEEVVLKPKEEPKVKKQDKPQISTPLKDNPLPPQPMLPSTSKPNKQEPLNPALEAKETNDTFMFGTLPASVPKKDKHNVVEKEIVGEKTDLNEGKVKGKEALLEKEIKSDFESRMGLPNDARGGYQSSKPEDNKNVLAKRGAMNEDRRVLMNVGVGVLVIVALGVQVSYSLGLIGKEK